MTPKNPLSSRRFAALAALVLLAAVPGCNVVPPAQDDPTRYFVLSDPPAQAVPSAPSPSAARVGLKAVQLENYLKHREMVVETASNEVRFEDYRRWAEPLDAAVGRVLRETLVGSPGIGQVVMEPFPFDGQRDYDVSVNVRSCEGTLAASGRYEASFSAVIEITTVGADAHVVARKLFVAPAAPWDGSDYGRLASLLSADVAALGQEIASDIPARN